MRGASWGFSVLLVGELLVLNALGMNDGLVLYVVAAAAYALAGNRAVRPPIASVRDAARDGALAATGAYALTVPLRLIVGSTSTTVLSVVVAAAFAAVVGGLAGTIVGRARIDEEPPPD